MRSEVDCMKFSRGFVATNNIKTNILGDIEKTDSISQFAAAQECPGCKQKALKVTMAESGRKNWETHLTCINCGTAAIINNTGYHFEIKQKEASK